MIDFHSHLLPGIDDGSDSISVSVTMLGAWKDQGISDVVATPHFYADMTDPQSFLLKRDSYQGAIRHLIHWFLPLNQSLLPFWITFLR